MLPSFDFVIADGTKGYWLCSRSAASFLGCIGTVLSYAPQCPETDAAVGLKGKEHYEQPASGAQVFAFNRLPGRNAFIDAPSQLVFSTGAELLDYQDHAKELSLDRRLTAIEASLTRILEVLHG